MERIELLRPFQLNAETPAATRNPDMKLIRRHKAVVVATLES